jgi:hypothetical protein
MPGSLRLGHNTNVIPDELRFAERDPWFDRPFDRLTVLSKVEGLTTLSEVEGESRKLLSRHLFLDPGSPPALQDLAGMTNYNSISLVVDFVTIIYSM